MIKRRCLALAAGVLVTSSLMAGCTSATSGHAVATTSRPTPAHTASSAVTRRPAPTSFAQLEALLIPTVPAGFVQQPDNVGDTGPSSLAKATRDDRQPGAAQALRTDRFQRGYQRLWINKAGDQIVVFLYQFAASPGAADYYRRSVQEATSTAPPTATRLAIRGLPPSQATGLMARVSSRTAAVAVAFTGPFLMQIDCNAKSGSGLRSELDAVTLKQFKRL